MIFVLYSRGTGGGGAITKSTSAGGALVESTKSGGGTSKSTASGGGSTQTSKAGGASTQTSSAGGGTTASSTFASPTFFIYSSTPLPLTDVSFENHYHAVEVADERLRHNHQVTIPNHTHQVSIPAHTHEVDIPAHTHDFTVPAHTHEVDIPSHTHQVVLPDHTHDIDYGIYELDTLPTAVKIEVDGNLVPVTSTSGNEIDIIPYLAKDDGGKVLRGQWHEVKITPNGLGRITANIISRMFISSHTGGTY